MIQSNPNAILKPVLFLPISIQIFLPNFRIMASQFADWPRIKLPGIYIQLGLCVLSARLEVL